MAIRELGYVVIETAKPVEWREFLTNVAGVMVAENAADGADHYRIDDRPFRFRIEQAGAERLAAAAYEIDTREALDALAARVEAAGRAVMWGDDAQAAARHVDAYFRTSDPAGNGLEFFVGTARDDVEFVSPQGVSGFVTGEMGMGHAVFSAPDFSATHAFYRDTIGFHDTDLPVFHLMGPDGPPMHFAFMHADNVRHHSLALGEGPAAPTGCIHLMLEMCDMMDVGKCYDRMRLAGVPESATLGRHTNDEMTSFYMQTPSGFDLEIGCDGLVIDPANWETTAHKTISEWGHVWAWQKAMEEAAANEAARAEAAE
ncbi:MAG: VOC family protein [Erythrobacter sp.]|uniref:VOC family protein n=1 Tax=Erythrobacter sp. TaxID=1042 RepID=UPI003A8C8261